MDGLSDQLANLLAQRFISRSDVKAWQEPSGIYRPDRTKITRADLNAHIARERTMGHYLLGTDDRCKFFCFDIDLAKQGVWDGQPIEPRKEFLDDASPYREGLTGQLVIAAESLAREANRAVDVPVAIAFSGSKGVHVYGFTGPEPAADQRTAALSILESIGSFKPLRGANFFAHENPEMSVEIEVFPKQGSLDGKDLGNLLRLPLGRNLKSGREGCFLRCGGGKRAKFARMDPIAALSGVLPWEN